MIDNREAQDQWITSTKALLKSADLQSQNVLLKFHRMQDIYLTKNNTTYSQDQIEYINKQSNSLSFRYRSTSLSLEQLWALSMSFQWRNFNVFNEIDDINCWRDDDIAIGLIVMESFLFHARSFLDIYMLYICLIMGMEKPKMMTTSEFKKFTRSIERTPFNRKSDKIRTFFEDNILSEGSWGYTLRSLRDKITHRETLRYTRRVKRSHNDKDLIWPTILNESFADVAQYFKNGLFSTIQQTSPLLFDLEWKAGPYKPDLWE